MEDGGWYETRKEKERTREEDRETRGKCVTRRKTEKERERDSQISSTRKNLITKFRSER